MRRGGWTPNTSGLCPPAGRAYIYGVMSDCSESDLALLRAWVTRRDREAAGCLVRRHFNFVQSVARRRVGNDEHLAEDVTQAVFILLLNNAHKIRTEAGMSSWLYATTGYAASNALKMLRRRRHHEEQHAMRAQSPPLPTPYVAAESADLQPLVHEAIDQLTRADRLCVVMSFLQEKTHDEVAAAMGVSPAAARKRISRAVERMREFLAARGMVVPATAIPATLAIKQAIISPALVESTLNVAILAQSTGAGPAGIIAKAVSNMMFATKMKIAASVALMLMFGGLVTGQVVKMIAEPAAQTPVAISTPAAPSPNPGGDLADNGVVDLGGGVVVQFVGVTPFDGNQWNDINGWPIDPPEGVKSPRGNVGIVPRPTHRALVRIKAPIDVDVFLTALGPGSMQTGSSGVPGGRKDYQLAFSPAPGTTSISIDVWIADGLWTQMRSPHIYGDGMMSMTMNGFGATLTPLIDQNGQSMVFLSTSTTKGLKRISVVGIDGKIYPGQSQGRAGAGGFDTEEFVFPLSSKQVKSLMIQTRAYNKHVIAENIAVDANHPTAAKIIINPK
jgi:RNA polymerase sigma factor (sigma-70 family)